MKGRQKATRKGGGRKEEMNVSKVQGVKKKKEKKKARMKE